MRNAICHDGFSRESHLREADGGIKEVLTMTALGKVLRLLRHSL